MFCVLICYVMPGCFALCCPKNFSAQSEPVLFCASDNKRLEHSNATPGLNLPVTFNPLHRKIPP